MLQISKYSIFHHDVEIWNNLIPEIKSIANKSNVIKVIRKEIIYET